LKGNTAGLRPSFRGTESFLLGKSPSELDSKRGGPREEKRKRAKEGTAPVVGGRGCGWGRERDSDWKAKGEGKQVKKMR